jgi:hypothetical protein
MLAKLRGHVAPHDGAGRACKCSAAFVMLSITRALAYALDLAGLGTSLWLLLLLTVLLYS